MRKLSTLMLGLLLSALCLYGCGGNDGSNTELPNIDELGAIQLEFNADGTQPRFSDATNYRIFVFIPGTTTQLISTVFFNRVLSQNLQSVLLNAVPAGSVDVVIEALNSNSQIVGQARADGVVVVTSQATLVRSSDLVGFGVSQGVDFTGAPNGDEVITVQASAGTTPTYTWDGAQARDVSVVRVNDPNNAADVTPVWGVSTVDVDGLVSPVVHGQVPVGALLTVNNEPVLIPGQTYRVSVVRLNGEFGVAEFIP